MDHGWLRVEGERVVVENGLVRVAGPTGKVGGDGGMDLPDRWLALSVPIPPRGEEHLIVEALLRIGSRSVQREGERYVAIVPPPEDLGALLGRAEAAIRASTSLTAPDLAWSWAPPGAWGGGEEPVAAPFRWRNGREIQLEPGPAFGDGSHPTTRSCLEFLETMVAPGDRIADLGTGTGILAIAAAALGAREVLAIEADPLSAALARRNVARNGAEDRVRVRELLVGADDLPDLGVFHGIVANLDGRTLLELLEAFASAPSPLHKGGWLIVSGAHRGEGADVRRRAEERGLVFEGERVADGWWTGVFRRPEG